MKSLFCFLAAVLVLVGCRSPHAERQAEGAAGLPETAVVIDVRTPGEYASGHVTGTTNVPISELEERIGQVVPDVDTPVAVHCHSGNRAAKAAQLLTSKGYNVRDLGSLENARSVIEGK